MADSMAVRAGLASGSGEYAEAAPDAAAVSSDCGDKNAGGGGNLKNVGEVGFAPTGEKGAPLFKICCWRCSKKCHGDAGTESGVLGMDSGVTGNVNGAGSVIGGLGQPDRSGFWRGARGGRLRERFFSGSLRFGVREGIAAAREGVAADGLLPTTSTNTSSPSSSSSSFSTEDGVSLVPRPLSPPVETRLLSPSQVSHQRL
jgi:hypothetical protein